MPTVSVIGAKSLTGSIGVVLTMAVAVSFFYVGPSALMPALNPVVPHGLPVIPEELRPTARVLTRGSQKASEDEVLRNPRAASVRLRAVEKVDAREV